MDHVYQFLQDSISSCFMFYFFNAGLCDFISFHFKFFIHGGPINQEWLLFRGPWKKPNYNTTKIKKNIYNVKLE